MTPEQKLNILRGYLIHRIQADKDKKVFDEYLSREDLREALILHNQFMLDIIEKGWKK